MSDPFVKPTTMMRVDFADGVAVVIVDRIVPGATTDYCIHGQTTCCRCSEWCWLGSETYRVVASGEAAPLCMQCANTVHVASQGSKRRHLHDHRRADGPHT